MNDTGNFVIVDSISRKIWESFRFPTDTILPTHVMERAEEINSKISETNFSTGRFQLRLLKDGNIILRKRDIPSGILYNVYYRSGTRDDSNMTNSGLQLTFNETGYMYILRRSGQIFELNKKDALPSKLYYQRATLDSDGCPQGFSLLDLNDPNGDCKPDFPQTCDKGYDRDRFGFIELTNIDWLESDYVRMQPTTEENCKTFCLQDCFCAVAIYRDKQCWKKKLPLSNGKKDPSLVVKAFLKSRKGDFYQQPPSVFSPKHKSQRSLIVMILSAYVLVIFLSNGVIYMGFFRIYKKTTKNHYPSNKSVDTNLPCFAYQELVEATNEFKDELGKGAFGIVYKGVIEETTVAVKK
ncbi:putative non-specific serine/threonine protein kinase [Helianthus annuus]|nr:putative non-specific serine/threonine protein kinase [Helianthus annuus]KAJ0909516.1 putative non-specific serine/threonine protein kinase [Helianthus annuus]